MEDSIKNRLAHCRNFIDAYSEYCEGEGRTEVEDAWAALNYAKDCLSLALGEITEEEIRYPSGIDFAPVEETKEEEDG